MAVIMRMMIMAAGAVFVMMRMMIGGKIQGGLDKAVEGLAVAFNGMP